MIAKYTLASNIMIQAFAILDRESRDQIFDRQENRLESKTGILAAVAKGALKTARVVTNTPDGEDDEQDRWPQTGNLFAQALGNLDEDGRDALFDAAEKELDGRTGVIANAARGLFATARIITNTPDDDEDQANPI